MVRYDLLLRPEPADFVDLYGRGYSDAPQVTYDTTLHTTQLALLMQYVKWDNAFIVGLSMVNLFYFVDLPLNPPPGRWDCDCILSPLPSSGKWKSRSYCFSRYHGGKFQPIKQSLNLTYVT
jgi:hypothetical protein